MQTHLAARPLKGTQKPDKDVRVLFATQPNSKAILFIHGYGGDVITTWSDFHDLLPGCSKCGGHDLFFYGYDGLRADMNASAAIFRTFLDRLFEKTASFLAENLPPSARRPTTFQYDELVIVAHSLGAVISRRSLLDATKERSEWINKIRLVLYAPAHKGAKVADLALETVSSFNFLKFFALAARFESPLIDALKRDSPELKTLLNDTMAARKKDANKHLRASKVVIAEYEKIVSNETFADDAAPVTIPNATHTTVCKPKPGFLTPLTLLEECL